jgi:hypothetical protein
MEERREDKINQQLGFTVAVLNDAIKRDKRPFGWGSGSGSGLLGLG